MLRLVDSISAYGQIAYGVTFSGLFLAQCRIIEKKGRGSKPGNRDVRNRVFYTVHNIVSSTVEPARAISRGCHLAGTRIGTRD